MVILSRYLPFWLATVTPNQVDETMRPKLVRYQTELVDVLNWLYGQELTPQRDEAPSPEIAAVERRLDGLFVELRAAA